VFWPLGIIFFYFSLILLKKIIYPKLFLKKFLNFCFWYNIWFFFIFKINWPGYRVWCINSFLFFFKLGYCVLLCISCSKN
jgi:hypothetical protein